MPLLFAIFIVVPIIEIGLFVFLGGLIGFWATMAMIVVTAILGSFLLRTQGLSALAKIQNQIASAGLPGTELAHGAMILVAGVLLLTPGFFTDALGFLLFVPAFRTWAFKQIKSQFMANVNVSGFSQQSASYQFSQNGDPTDPYGEETTPEDGGTINLDPDSYRDGEK